jgi:GxxExxY protein
VKQFQPIPEATEIVATAVIDAAFKVHKTLGPGLLETVYETCLAHELRKRALALATQVAVPVVYDDIRVDGGLRLDMLVDDRVIVELKATESMDPLHEAQLLTYLKLTGHRLGLLINFNTPLLKKGIKRIVL